MANALFARGKEGFLAGDVDWDANNIKVVLVDHGADTPLPATDDFLSDILVGARIATSGNLASKTTTDGVADAADLTPAFTAPAAGTSCESLVIYQDTGVAGTSILLVFIDTATGLPLTTSGGDIDIIWDGGAAKIFAL